MPGGVGNYLPGPAVLKIHGKSGDHPRAVEIIRRAHGRDMGAGGEQPGEVEFHEEIPIAALARRLAVEIDEIGILRGNPYPRGGPGRHVANFE